MSKKKTSLGRDPFEDDKEQRQSKMVEKLIKGGPKGPGAKEVAIEARLTPANIKHLDRIRQQLAKRGRGDVSRNDLIRIAITLLSADDV